MTFVPFGFRLYFCSGISGTKSLGMGALMVGGGIGGYMTESAMAEAELEAELEAQVDAQVDEGKKEDETVNIV
eukprot:1331969-Amorphochlora_amoeboformis.AAC.3